MCICSYVTIWSCDSIEVRTFFHYTSKATFVDFNTFGSVFMPASMSVMCIIHFDGLFLHVLKHEIT